jgi:hypothetical protein
VVGAVAGRAVPVAIPAVIVREETLEGGQEVVVRARPDLHDDDAGGGVRDEDGQQPVALVGDERGAGLGEVRQPRIVPGPDGQLGRPYGKMLRSASRMRPSPPPAGADS